MGRGDQKGVVSLYILFNETGFHVYIYVNEKGFQVVMNSEAVCIVLRIPSHFLLAAIFIRNV